MKKFHLKFREIFIILIVGFPAGFYLYYYNNQKIIFDVMFNPGVAVATNFCNNLDYTRKNLYKNVDIDNQINILGLSKKVFRVLPSSDFENIKISVYSEMNSMEIHKQELLKLKEGVINTENAYFEKFYENINLRCESGVNYKVFTKIPGKIFEIHGTLRKRYNNTHLVIIFISPFIILIIFIYLIKNYLFKKDKNLNLLR